MRHHDIRQQVMLPVDKYCIFLKNSVYLKSLLLLLINQVPRMKQRSKHLSITGVLRLSHLRVHISPHGSVIFGMVLFVLSLLCLPSLTSGWRSQRHWSFWARSRSRKQQQRISLCNSSYCCSSSSWSSRVFMATWRTGLTPRGERGKRNGTNIMIGSDER